MSFVDMSYNGGHSILKILSLFGSLGVVAFLGYGKAWAHSYEAGLCLHATRQVERALQIPDGFLTAISRVETGRPDIDGTIAPWPWTVTAAGMGHYYATREEAIEAVKEFRRQGILSVDVGCMQVNLQQHPKAFLSIEQAFDPMFNAQYAGEFLLRLYAKMGSWPHAAAAYHSQTPSIGLPYQWKVLEAWSEPQGRHFVRAGISGAEYLNAEYNKEPIESRVSTEARELESLSSLAFVTVSHNGHSRLDHRVNSRGNHRVSITLYGESSEIPLSYAKNMQAYFKSRRDIRGIQRHHFASYHVSPVALAAIASALP